MPARKGTSRPGATSARQVITAEEGIHVPFLNLLPPVTSVDCQSQRTNNINYMGPAIMTSREIRSPGPSSLLIEPPLPCPAAQMHRPLASRIMLGHVTCRHSKEDRSQTARCSFEPIVIEINVHHLGSALSGCEGLQEKIQTSSSHVRGAKDPRFARSEHLCLHRLRTSLVMEIR